MARVGGDRSIRHRLFLSQGGDPDKNPGSASYQRWSTFLAPPRWQVNFMFSIVKRNSSQSLDTRIRREVMVIVFRDKIHVVYEPPRCFQARVNGLASE
jgi:hypothetical protein